MIQLLSMKNTFKNKNLFYKKGIRVRHHLLQDKNATLRDKSIRGIPDPNLPTIIWLTIPFNSF